MTRSKSGVLLGLCLLLAFILNPPAGSGGADKAVSVLRVGGPMQLAPLAYLDNAGVYTGFSVDIVHALGAQLGAENVLFYPAMPAENQRALADGQLDCVQGARYSPAVAQNFIFTAFYLESPSLIFIDRERFDMANASDLQGKRVAVLEDDPAWERLKASPKINFILVKHLEQGFYLLRTGKADAYIGERLTTLRFLGERKWNHKFKTVGQSVARSRYGILVRKDQQELAGRLNRAIAQMRRNGEQARIFKQWFGEEVLPQPFFSLRILRWVFVFVGASLLVAMIALGWNLLLQRELELKAIAIEKARLDHTIAEEKSRFEAIVQSMTEGLMLVDLDGRIAYVNAQGAQYLGRRVEDLRGRPLASLKEYLFTLVKDRDLLARRLEQAELAPTRPAAIEYSVMTTRRQDIRLKLFPVRNLKGEFSGRGVLIEDLSREREVERLKAEFVSVASHEMRTPMTSILGFSELMLTKQLSPETSRHYNEQIHNEAERLTRILNDMLDLTYLESGEGVLNKQPVQVPKLAQEVLQAFRAQLRERREVRLKHDDQIQLILADRDKLAQVLWNLLSNADKYSPPDKEVLIEIRNYSDFDAAWEINAEESELLVPGVELKVIDFGQGIPSDQLSLIFLPFHRVETAVHTIRGTGLGLAIVKRIVEAHGGRVWAQSQLGQHTVFTVLLPARSTDPAGRAPGRLAG